MLKILQFVFSLVSFIEFMKQKTKLVLYVIL